LLSSQTHHGPHQIVGGDAHLNLFGRHLGSRTTELLHPQLGFRSAQIGLDMPAPP
jgi:hypothetical protein